MEARALKAIAAVAALAAALVGIHVAFGGGSYRPTPPADPCAPRTWREPDGVAESLEQVALAAAAGAACELGVPREEVVLAFRSVDALSKFTREHDLSAADVERAVRAAVVRAVEDSEAAGAIGDTLASLIRGAAERLAIRTLLELLRGVSGVLDLLS